ncbi:carbohydrate ABC transporter permease [Pseudonocardia sp. KRD-184]|uniref:Carbohydrate ABC transporter permease n=1 Tax=Pseudonocardia oceani TaxID=2792013 RepID=A0ABS6U223_9PSEU|nr:carbohydrate ABC transporter permease [Pseudonocardia oceani]MBW0089190.1 carbohydrate ABC transporter permease [Pseudonocardia oceani]MBW0096136.1 carbohydrate ABC transporter permease [Pseudonocardia oceani]MBW0108900.1 carbohydrate ABC transporter permease [Pseudonocardia oceani]MBW0123028.1 carbohydrate ABC transporter permease [Pseudonocardia oceani]MBW0126169.1 carbohydrate ABC transporter permease [Pseudonocardia oceani]
MSILEKPESGTARPEPVTPSRRPRRYGRSSLLVGGLLVLICLAMLSPVLWTAATVTKPTDVAFLNPPQFFYEPTVTSFVDLWQTTQFYKYLINTLVVAVLSTIAALVIGIPAAYALSRYPGWVSAVLLIAALVFRALPRFSVVLPMYDISRALGVYDTTFAVAAALVAINQPFSIWLLRNFFAEIPKELDEAAMLDGCTRFQTLRRVMVPLMGPGILTAGIFIFLFAFQEYLTANILTDVSARTVPVFIATQLGQTLPMLQQAGAAAMLLTLPVVAFAFIAQRYLVAGLNAGSVKG